MLKFFKRYFELAVWIIVLVLMAFMDPATNSDYSFCPFNFIGFNHCPGCGLGHSISFIFHGDLHASFSSHPLGLFAIAIILFRIYKLASLQLFFKLKKLNHGQ
ncbi:MAG: DUF2752 domain-containing protein [Ginsengibacter sp.]